MRDRMFGNVDAIRGSEKFMDGAISFQADTTA